MRGRATLLWARFAVSFEVSVINSEQNLGSKNGGLGSSQKTRESR